MKRFVIVVAVVGAEILFCLALLHLIVAVVVDVFGTLLRVLLAH